MYYTYLLQSMKDKEFYTGFTKNLKLRFEQGISQLIMYTFSHDCILGQIGNALELENYSIVSAQA